MIEKNIAIFSYSFSHKKTTDFLLMLKAYGFINVCVIAAPKVKLKSLTTAELVYTSKQEGVDLSTEVLCKNLGYSFKEIEHSDYIGISNFLVDNNSPSLALISGARIIKSNIIELFEEGVINFHPGSVPETSGLDSFYWMIENNSLPGTTVHFIDEKVDAGSLLFFHELNVHEEDDLVTIKQRLYQNQISALKRLIAQLTISNPLCSSKINRPYKNHPMTVSEKSIVVNKGKRWIKYVRDIQEELNICFEAIVTSDDGTFYNNYKRGYHLKKNVHGRTLLAEAAFHHRYNIAKFLIDEGADVNAQNDKGTTVLMYAKTKLIGKNIYSEGVDLLRLLKESGADYNVLDRFNKSVFEYIPDDNHTLIELIKA